MTDQILLICGATIFGVLGTIHLVYTFFSIKFNAYDKNVTKAIKETSPILTKETSMWKAWVGFNASDSLGAMLVTAFYVPLTISNMEVIRGNLWISVLPIFIGLSYLALANKYWFKVPFIGNFMFYWGGSINKHLVSSASKAMREKIRAPCPRLYVVKRPTRNDKYTSN